MHYKRAPHLCLRSERLLMRRSLAPWASGTPHPTQITKAPMVLLGGLNATNPFSGSPATDPSRPCSLMFGHEGQCGRDPRILASHRIRRFKQPTCTFGAPIQQGAENGVEVGTGIPGVDWADGTVRSVLQAMIMTTLSEVPHIRLTPNDLLFHQVDIRGGDARG